MRLARLDLAAFGPFTERALDFGGGSPGGLHLVYGRNAAGKSSALRAITDLFFGFPTKSGDDHVHPYQALRIRAVLESASGERLLVQRLKRNKDSLRDGEDAPLDELTLKRLLGNVDRTMFERVFGLDHERLREAGQALLEGGGDVGESLFDAGAGGHGVRRILTRLRDEAERLFKPRGGKQEIVQLLENYKTARERVGNAAHLPDKYAEQQRELERFRGEREALERDLTERRREREHGRTLQKALKGVATRGKLLADLESLGDVPELPADFGERRERVQTALAAHRENVARAERELRRLQDRAAELHPKESLLAIDEQSITFLREGIGSTKKALADLPARESTLAERRAEAQVAERQLGLDGSRLTPEAVRARRPEEARFRKLLAERATLAERRRAAQERLRQVELDYETHRARLRALPDATNLEALERAVLAARHAGDVEAAQAAARAERAEVDRACRAEVAMLAPFDGTLAELCELAVPAAETVQAFEQAFAELEERRKHLAGAMAACRDRTAALERELAAEERAGAIPSEEELARARALRDERFDDLCKNWPEKSKGTLSLFEAARVREYRTTVSAADVLADRLRREAARVAENARRAAELTQLRAEATRLLTVEAVLESDSARLQGEWSERWSAAGFAPVGPAPMRAWLARRDRAVALVIKEAAIRERERALAESATALGRALAEALGGSVDGTPIAVAAERALERLDEERRLAAERKALAGQIAELEVRRDAARAEVAQRAREAELAEAELVDVITTLGFERTIPPEEVEARLGALADLVNAREQTRDLERRISGMKRDVAAFEREVTAVIAAHAPDLTEIGSRSPDRAASEIVSRFERAKRDAEALERLHAEMEERRAELLEERALLERAETDARALLTLANTSDLADAAKLEARARRARELRAELEGIEASLREMAGPRGLSAFLEEASQTDPALLSARLDELDGDIEELERKKEESIRTHQSVQAGLELYSDTTAVEAAEEERALASALIERSERWAKLKLAEVLLAREVERYREQNQGPVLRRAAALFTRLSREEYTGLRVGREERALVAVRGKDLEVSVDGLNEAARYHLYLALRLASLERYLEHAEAMPFVLDDVLIHFDEEGARAAFGVLGELAERVQVLVFTHHRHNVALAESAVPRGQLFLHEL